MSDFSSSLRQQFNINARLCFMVMPFRSALNKVYDAVEEVTEYCGLTCLRADKIHGPRRITSPKTSANGKANHSRRRGPKNWPNLLRIG